METDKFKILNNFLDDKSQLLDSQYREDFIPLRQAYEEELSQPGCTQCIRNACRNKYTQRIMGILNGEIDPKAPPPKPKVSNNKNTPPSPKVIPPKQNQPEGGSLPPPPQKQTDPTLDPFS